MKDIESVLKVHPSGLLTFIHIWFRGAIAVSVLAWVAKTSSNFTCMLAQKLWVGTSQQFHYTYKIGHFKILEILARRQEGPK